MSQVTLTQFESAVLNSSNQIGLCTVLALAWLATADGNIDPAEEHNLREIATAGKNEAQFAVVLEAAKRGDVRDLQLACEIIEKLEQDTGRLFLRMAIGMALSDGVLNISESHILRLMSDILGLGVRGLDEEFQEATGHHFPAPTDPSTIAWWEQRETRRSAKSAQDKPGRHQRETTHSDHQRLRDLAQLDLDENADRDEIERAYRSSLKRNHPDVFHSLGEEAVKAAEIRFRRVKEAYDRLTS